MINAKTELVNGSRHHRHGYPSQAYSNRQRELGLRMQMSISLFKVRRPGAIWFGTLQINRMVHHKLVNATSTDAVLVPKSDH